jgi:hypothetical protein
MFCTGLQVQHLLNYDCTRQAVQLSGASDVVDLEALELEEVESCMQ